MVVPLKQWFTVFNAIDATTTARIPTLGSEFPEHANSIILEIVGAASPSWTLDIQGRTHQLGTYVAVDYVQIWQAGAAALANAQLSITDTTRRFYLIPNCPPFLQLIATRTDGTLTIRGSYTSEVFSQWLLTTARGAVFVEGPTASDAAEAGNPVQVGGSVDETSPVSATEGDVRRARVSAAGAWIVRLSDGGTTYPNIGAANDDSLGNATTILDVRAIGMQLDPYLLAYERVRGNSREQALASAARTASTNSATLVNRNAKGLYVWLTVTANPGGAETLQTIIQASFDGGTTFEDLTGDTAQAFGGVAGNRLLELYPGIGAAADGIDYIKSAALPRTYRVRVVHSAAGSWTYAVEAGLIL